MQGTSLSTTMTLGTQTITDRAATTAGADISAALLTASTYANSSVAAGSAQVSYLQNAAIDAINSSQKISFSTKNDMLTALNAGVAANPAALGALFTALTTATAYGITGTGTGGAVTTAENTSLVAAQTASSGQSNALSAITAIDNALTEVNTASATQGALQNRFSAVISNLTAFSQSQTAAKSRIVDADFAAETAKLSKNQILSQAGTAMLAQANQLPSGVLSLLR
jgi:flagellin